MNSNSLTVAPCPRCGQVSPSDDAVTTLLLALEIAIEDRVDSLNRPDVMANFDEAPEDTVLGRELARFLAVREMLKEDMA